jgi:hypothetical protein
MRPHDVDGRSKGELTIEREREALSKFTQPYPISKAKGLTRNMISLNLVYDCASWEHIYFGSRYHQSGIRQARRDPSELITEKWDMPPHSYSYSACFILNFISVGSRQLVVQ